MKYFLIIAALGLLPIFSFAQNMAGTWVWVGAGCRDSSLSQDSHVTRPSSENPFQISASRLNLNEDGSASMSIDTSIEGEEQTQNETGSYTVRNNKVLIIDPEYSPTQPALVLDIVGDTLILSNRSVNENDDSEDSRQFSQHFNRSCDGNNIYVYVFGNVD